MDSINTYQILNIYITDMDQNGSRDMVYLCVQEANIRLDLVVREHLAIIVFRSQKR